jgi:DNA-binding response OmpR family regulator
VARQNLLLVDGDTRSRRVLEVSLRKAGFSVTTAENLEQALLVLQHGEPDLIISDTRLQPEHDGFEFCLEVKKNPKWTAIPFVFLTSAKAIEDKVRGLELGVEDYLVKPIYIKEVTTRLRMLVQRKQRERLEKKDTARTKFTGHLADMAVVDLFQTIEISRKSGTIQFETELGEATIWFRDGSVIDAEMGRLQADQAVYRLLGLNDGSFAVEFKPINRNAVIQDSTQGLLMEGMRRVDEWGRLLEQLPPLDSVLCVDRAALADMPDGLLSTELTEVLRRFDGRRTILGVVDETGKDDLEALEAISSLFFQGLLTATDDTEEDTVELGDSSTALRLEAWDMPSASQVEAFIPPKSTPESGPHAIPSEVPPMPSFPSVGENLAGESGGGLVAGLPDETPTIGEGLTSLHEPRPRIVVTRAAEESDPGMRALTDRFASLSASDSMEQPLQRDDDDDSDNPAFSQLGRTLKAIVDAEDEDDALALTEPVKPEPPSEFVAARMRAEQEEAARRRAEEELERREAERAGREPAIETTPAPDVTTLAPGPGPRTSPLDGRRQTEAARERSRSLTEPMFVAPRPAPVVVNDEEDDDASASQDGPAVTDASAAKTRVEPIAVFVDEEKLAVGGESITHHLDAPSDATSPAARTTPPKPEPRRLAAPAPRTEPTWTRPPTLQELGLDFGKKPAGRSPVPEPAHAIETKPIETKPIETKPADIEQVEIDPLSIELDEPEPVAAKPVELDKPDKLDKLVEAAANQAPSRAKDSSTSNTTAGVIGTREDDDFAPVAVKSAEPAQEPPRSSPSLQSRFDHESEVDEPYDEEDEDDDDDAPLHAASRPVSAPIVRDDVPETPPAGSKLGLWIALGVVGIAIVGLVAFKDAIFPSGDGDPKDPATTGGKTDGSDPADDEGKSPEPDSSDVGATSTTTSTTTGAVEPATETDSGEPSDTAAPATETEAGEPALDIEAELASARRYFTKFRRTEDAKAIIDKILEVDPDHAPTLILRAQLLVEEENFDDALATARRAKLANPDDPEVYSLLATLLENENDAAGAIEAYERYLELDPGGKYASVAKSAIRRLEKTLK